MIFQEGCDKKRENYLRQNEKNRNKNTLISIFLHFLPSHIIGFRVFSYKIEKIRFYFYIFLSNVLFLLFNALCS